MRILLTGAGGLVGRPLVRRLASRHEVVALRHADLDVTDAALTAKAVAQAQPDAVVHLAAWTDVDGCERDPDRATRVNGDGTRHVAEACRSAGAPLHYVSTDYVFDGTKAGPWVETDEPHPLSAYGRSKLAGEEHVRGRAARWTIVRSQSIYGAGKKSFVDSVLARAASGGELSVVTDQRVSPTWAEDLAGAIALLVQTGASGVYHVANAGSCTWHECARAALDIAGHPSVPIREIRAADLARPAPRPANSAFDCSKFERDTGASLRPWRAALAAYLATCRAGKEAS